MTTSIFCVRRFSGKLKGNSIVFSCRKPNFLCILLGWQLKLIINLPNIILCVNLAALLLRGISIIHTDDYDDDDDAFYTWMYVWGGAMLKIYISVL